MVDNFKVYMSYPVPYLLMKLKERNIDSNGMTKKQMAKALSDIDKKNYDIMYKKAKKQIKGL